MRGRTRTVLRRSKVQEANWRISTRQPGVAEGKASRSNVRYAGDKLLTAQIAFGRPIGSKVYCGVMCVTRFGEAWKSIYSFLVIALRRNRSNQLRYTFRPSERSTQSGKLEDGFDPAES